MRLETAYNRINRLIWNGRLPKPGKLEFIDSDAMPNSYGITCYDGDFVRPVIFLNAGDKRWGKILIHECLHVAEPMLPHGPIFELLVSRYWRLAKKNIRGLK
jgi:hypothetical protein